MYRQAAASWLGTAGRVSGIAVVVAVVDAVAAADRAAEVPEAAPSRIRRDQTRRDESKAKASEFP